MKSILIVEDDKEINCMLSEYLSSQGYETLSVLNGLEAVRTVREQDTLSLLILDLMIPFKSGDMVLQKIREFSDIPVIVVSAKSETHSKIELLRNGADDYITRAAMIIDGKIVVCDTLDNLSQGKSLEDAFYDFYTYYQAEGKGGAQ